jgi:uncharacterized protein involved in outer membrane biogenesis
MKKVFIVIGSLFILLIASIVAIPILFKDDIKKAIDDAIAENINAEVFYDVDGFSVSLIKNFPNLSVSMSEFGISGKDEFSQDTLASIGTFRLTVDLMSLFGDQITINEVLLDNPCLLLHLRIWQCHNWPCHSLKQESKCPDYQIVLH